MQSLLYRSLLNLRSLNHIPKLSTHRIIYKDANNNERGIINHKGVLNFTQNKTSLYQIQIQKRFQLRGGAGYTGFGHGRTKLNISTYGKFYQLLLLLGVGFCLFGDFEKLVLRLSEPSKKLGDFINRFYKNSGASSNEDTTVEQIGTDIASTKESKKKKNKKSKNLVEEKEENIDEAAKSKKKRISFRDKKIIEYENRIREYSTPDKIFRYFATIKVWNETTNDYEIFMKPEDFVRSLTFNAKQPEGLGLDSYSRYDPFMHNLQIDLPEDSVFYRLGQHGLISFSDYLFLLTLLSTPPRHFEIAFKMYDLDASGNIDIHEFEHLQGIIRNNTQVGARHRDTRMTGSVLKENSALNKYFFGKDAKEPLTVEKFVNFQSQLQSEMIKMEFQRNEPIDGKITDLEFCETLLGYAGFNEVKTKRMLKRVAKKFNDSNEGISLQEYEDFFHVLRSIQDIDTALKFYSLAGASIDQTILKHVAKTVSGVLLSDHLVDVVFCLFDDNGDGKLSHYEFVNVMKKRWLRGLQNPKDTGFIRFLNAFYDCSIETIKLRYFY